MISKKLKKSQNKIYELELELINAQLDIMRLESFFSLINNLKRFDSFRFSASGAIVAYKKDEPELYGTMFIVPERSVKIVFA